jgi:DNA-binding CsgD family transcriptional regulator
MLVVPRRRGEPRARAGGHRDRILCATVLSGRRHECDTIDRLLAGLHEGRSGALVVRGDPGVGKSALLGYALERAGALRVVRAIGVDSEIELAFAGLHQLCAPLLDRREHLPEPQREALEVAFGLAAGAPPDRFLLGLSVLSLLAEAARERPLVCVVDDAHWLDRASLETLAFVARRLLAESVAVIFATRQAESELSGLPELVVGGLGYEDARDLLESVVMGPLDERVRERILAETHGNPLALLELPRGLTAAELAGGFALPSVPLSGRIEERFRQRIGPLPQDTRRLVLAAAADPVGDQQLLWRACERLGIAPEAAGPAEAAGLFQLGVRVTFFHPLVRSAVYRGATPDERREVHQALADATDAEHDPDRRAWHRAQAAAGPDEDVAAELERSAGRAQARGGLAAAAAFLERSVALTADPVRRTERALSAAQAKLQAGDPSAVLGLLAAAGIGPLDELQRARAERLRARLAFAQQRGRDAPPLLLQAAERLQALDPALARETYVEALGAALTAGRRESLEQASNALRAYGQPASAAELLMIGQALVITDGRAAGTPVLKRALDAFRSEPLSSADELQGLAFAWLVAINLWDDESSHLLSSRHVALAREAGALSVLPVALEAHSASEIFAGELNAAQALLDEAGAIADAAGSAPLVDAPLLLAGWRGDAVQAPRLIASGIQDAAERGEESTITSAEYAAAVLHNGLGRHAEALAAARRACEHHPARSYPKALVEMVEAAARIGMPDVAAAALEPLREATRAGGTDWALGIEARSSALMAAGEAADRLYREAIERLGRTRVRPELARAHLLYGEWLRRERRRVDARGQLRLAHELFAGMGAKAFAGRAARELQATGETARRRADEPVAQLTAQESQVARLASDGLTNPEIGARLFISARTVEHHLRNVYAKLDINSRTKLASALVLSAERS